MQVRLTNFGTMSYTNGVDLWHYIARTMDEYNCTDNWDFWVPAAQLITPGDLVIVSLVNPSMDAHAKLRVFRKQADGLPVAVRFDN